MDQLTEDSVRRALGATATPFRFFDSIGSTNTEAMEWASAGAPDGAVVVTAHQTDGRGRWGRAWSSEPGKLLQLSIVLRPKLPLDRVGLITTALGLSCAEAIENVCGLRPTIKWPNDVRINARKVAGILVESVVTGASMDVAIAGIGINVGWTEAEVPKELEGAATSLAIELDDGAPPPPTALLRELLGRFERHYRPLPMNAGDVVAAARDRSDVLGRDVVVALSDTRTIEGRAVALGPSGELELRTGDGVTSVAVGEVQRLR